jgi:hypothetical protein
MINYWNSNTLPYSWYEKNKETNWLDLDSPENQDKNWTTPITYKFNAQGFRTHDLLACTNKQVNIALGCSHTMGIGLPIEMTWPSIIEEQTQIVTLNLGLGSGTTDTVSRILTNVCGMFSIHTVYILWPSKNRFELYSDDQIITVLPHSALLEHIWFMEDGSTEQRFNKNQSIVNNLQKLHGFNLKSMNSEPFTNWVVGNDRARDQTHAGYQSNLNLANMFLTM